ncbi:MAG: response regulator [Verrucomicrobiota bacterium]|nr:response regulator [Verrucomicrobiota bacterium]
MNPSPVHERDMNDKQTSQQADVLVVDDTPDNINVLREILGAAGYKIRAALNGNLALKAALAKTPDLILMDVVMPGMDGIETCRMLKANAQTREVPVLIISALDRTQDKLRGFEVGAVDYISKPFRAEEVLARVRTHLSLREARQQLEKQNQALRDAARLRDDVDHMLKHDLKGPLNAIIGYAQLIRETDSGEQTKEFSHIIEESGYSMLNMIHESFDLLKMERGTYELNPQPINLVALIQRITVESRTPAEKKQLTFATTFPSDENKVLLASGELLLCRSLFHNLLKNAVEAAPAGSEIAIHYELADVARVSITNQGEVPVAIRERFFDKFVTSGKVGGTGLGTYSARLMVESQRGSIRLDSRTAGQTTLIVELPLAHANGESAAMQPAKTPSVQTAAPALEPMPPTTHLLYADDDLSNHTYIRRILDSPTLKITTCANGLQAVKELFTHRYSLAIIDLEMPEMDGCTVAMQYQRELNQYATDATISRTYLIALTGHDAPSIRKRCLDCGFARVLTKPISPNDIRLVVQHQIAVGDFLPLALPTANNTMEVDPILAEIIPEFIASRVEQIPELKAAILAHDGERVRKLCHQITGSCSLHGFPTASDYYLEIATAVEHGNFAAAAAQCDALPAYWNSITLDSIPPNS